MSDIKTLKDIKADADPDVEILALRRANQGLRAEIKRLQADYGDLRGYFRDVAGAAGHLIIPPRESVYKPTKEKRKVKSPCAVVLHFSDWHYGAQQEADEIDHFNEFSPEILEGRIWNLVNRFLKYVNVQRAAYQIDELVILDTGDNISGDIHRELSITNAFPTPVQATKCGAFKGEVVSALAPHFTDVRVEFITADNHGRLVKKPQSKQEGLNSHNYVVGYVAQLVASKQENVTFNLHPQYTKAVTVQGRQYLLTHGHAIRGWAGFPYYGIERKVAKEALARLHEPPQNRFHKVIMGHFHAPLAHQWYWIGGSASGTDAFDHKQGRRAEPCQVAWLVHPRHGEFNRNVFRLKAQGEV